MERIIPIKGNVQYTITLDPSVWIFDDRRIDLTTYFDEERKESDELQEYTKEISKHWDREIIEGAIIPPTLKSEKKFKKEQVMTGTFGIALKPFLQNASPKEDASELILKAAEEEYSIPLETAFDLILGFSNNGKPLLEDGPVHVYFGDGSNKNNPIKGIKEMVIS